jgi:hypothetical protein
MSEFIGFCVILHGYSKCYSFPLHQTMQQRQRMLKGVKKEFAAIQIFFSRKKTKNRINYRLADNLQLMFDLRLCCGKRGSFQFPFTFRPQTLVQTGFECIRSIESCNIQLMTEIYFLELQKIVVATCNPVLVN